MKSLLATCIFFAGFFAAIPGWSAPDGLQLYEKHCSVCHQTKGWGGIGLPLRSEHIRVFSDDYLEKTIRLGRPGRVMPAFDFLSNAQVKALIEQIRSWSNDSPVDLPDGLIAGDIKAGEKTFADNCAVCHGKNRAISAQGTGVTLSRERSYSVIPPFLLNVGFLQSASDHMIKYIVENGVEGTAMQAFGKNKILKEAQINNVVAYLRSMEKVLLAERAAAEEPKEEYHASLVFESPYDLATTVNNLKEAITGANFRIFPERFLEQGLVDEVKINKKQIGVRFCNFKILYRMLGLEPRIGIVLPCRITAIEQDDGTVLLHAVNMEVVTKLFNNEEVEKYAKEMQEIQVEIIEEATL